MSGKTLSIAMIVLNEERRLERLLPQLRWADEVVVLDGGSCDGTLETARRHGCRVFSHPFDNYAAQRNRAIELCRGRWVFSLDADESFTPELVRETLDLVQRGEHDAWRVRIRSRIFGRKFYFSGTQFDRPIRLFRRTAARWTGAVHEVLKVDGSVGTARAWLDHDTIETLRAFFRKMERYTTLEVRQRIERGRPPRLRDLFWAPLRETARRMFWRLGMLDGPQGWAFCVLSGWSEWVTARKHRRAWRLWQQRNAATAVPPAAERRPIEPHAPRTAHRAHVLSAPHAAQAPHASVPASTPVASSHAPAPDTPTRGSSR